MNHQLNEKYETFRIFDHTNNNNGAPNASIVVEITRVDDETIHLFGIIARLQHNLYEHEVARANTDLEQIRALVSSSVSKECDVFCGFNTFHSVTNTSYSSSSSFSIIGLKFNGTDKQIKKVFKDWWHKSIKE